MSAFFWNFYFNPFGFKQSVKHLGWNLFITVGLMLTSFSQSLASVPETLLKVEKKYQKAGSFEAEFVQIDQFAVTGQKKTSKGKIIVQLPDRFRWETASPDPSTLTSDGILIWFYTPPFDAGESGQLIEQKSHNAQSKILTSLLSGSFSKVKNLKIEAAGGDGFILHFPKKSAGTVLSAKVSVDLEQSWISAVSLEHQGGNHTEVKLSKILLGKTYPASLFLFKAPPKTDIVREP